MERLRSEERQEGRGGEVSSIDLLEECHQTIYRLRTKCKEMRRYSTRLVHQTKTSSPLVSSSHSSDLRHENSFTLPSHEHNTAQSSPISSNLTRNHSLPLSSRSHSIDSHSGKNNEENLSPERVSQSKVVKSNHSNVKRSEGLLGFASLEEQKNDQIAADIFAAFKKELRHWWQSNPTKRSDEDIRGDLADDLTERFLCQRLDPLPASRVVTNIRKTMSQVIEEFASQGTLPSEIITPEEEKKVLEPVTKYAKEKQDLELKAIAEEKERRERQQKESQESQVRRAEQEKQRIKEQYEGYMKLKNQTKSVEKSDGKQEEELENHLDDIRSLISSIKGTAGPGK